MSINHNISMRELMQQAPNRAHKLTAPRAEFRERTTLHPHERAALALMAEGKPNKIIAYEMGLTEGSVKVYLSHAFKVLGLANRCEALRWAVVDPTVRPWLAGKAAA